MLNFNRHKFIFLVYTTKSNIRIMMIDGWGQLGSNGKWILSPKEAGECSCIFSGLYPKVWSFAQRPKTCTIWSQLCAIFKICNQFLEIAIFEKIVKIPFLQKSKLFKCFIVWCTYLLTCKQLTSCDSVRAWVRNAFWFLWTVHAKVLKFQIWIPHGKISEPYFYSCPSYVPAWSFASLKQVAQRATIAHMSPMCQGQISFQKTYKWIMETRGPKSNSSKLFCLSWLPATLMMIRSKMNKLAWRHHFPITSL